MGGLGGSTDLSGTRLFGVLNLDMIVFGAGTGMGIGGGGTDMFGRTGVTIGTNDIGTGADACDNTVDAAGSICGSGGGNGGGSGGGCCCCCTAACVGGKFGLWETTIGQPLLLLLPLDTIDALGEVCTIACGSARLVAD